MNKRMRLVALGLGLGLVAAMAAPAMADNQAKGFDEYGYNRPARAFDGMCESWYMGKNQAAEAQAEAYCGSCADDKLVMK